MMFQNHNWARVYQEGFHTYLSLPHHMAAALPLPADWVNDLFHTETHLVACWPLYKGSSNCPGGSDSWLFNGTLAVSSRKYVIHLEIRTSNPVELRLMGQEVQSPLMSHWLSVNFIPQLLYWYLVSYL